MNAGASVINFLKFDLCACDCFLIFFIADFIWRVLLHLQRGGEVDVRDNTEVWGSILDTTEQLLSALTDALLAWDRSQLRRLTAAANQMHSCLSRLQQVHSLQHLPQEFQVHYLFIYFFSVYWKVRTKGLLSVPTSENFKCITCNIAISLYKTNCLFLWTDRQIGVVSLSLLLVVLLITQVLVSGGAALARLVEWRCRELFQRGQKEGVMVASSQLRGAMILLAKVCVASSTADGLLTDSSHAKVRSHSVLYRCS